MTTDINEIGLQKVKSVATGESSELRQFWQDQSVAIVFFRRWGCMLCRLWAKELAEIAPILHKNNIKLVGVGVEEIGSKDFVEGKFFDGDLYYVEDQSTYQTLGFKRFNVVTIITSLFWKQSRDAIFKGRGMGLESDLVGDGLQNGGLVMVKHGGKVPRVFVQRGPADRMPNVDIVEISGNICVSVSDLAGEALTNNSLGSTILISSKRLGGDLKGDWVQTGGALLVQRGGNLLRQFVQTGPGDHLSNLDILKHFGLESEYNPETIANKNKECTTEDKQ